MATHDYVIANGTGAAVRSDLNGALAAIVSNNSSATAPATTYAYQWWADTTAGLLKLRNSANSAWVTLFELDGTFIASDISLGAGTVGAPSLFFTGDSNTGIYSPGADQIGISTGGTSRITIDASGNVNIDSNTLYVDAVNNRVGFSTTSPGGILDIKKSGASTTPNLVLTSGGAGDPSSVDPSIQFTASAFESIGTTKIMSTGVYGSRALAFHTGTDGAGVERSRIDVSGSFIVKGAGTAGSTQAVKLHGSAPVNSLNVDSSGRLLVGTSSGTSVGITVGVQYGGLHLQGGGGSWAQWGGGYGMFAYSGVGLGIATGAAIGFVNGAGSDIANINGTTGVYTPLSDARKKKDFEDSSVGLAEVLKLKPKLYRMLDDADDAPKELGFSAQDVKPVIPQAYVENKITEDNIFIGLQDRPIIAALVKGMQEQQAIITALEARLSVLEGA